MGAENWAAVAAYLSAACGSTAGEFVEVESGKSSQRPQLAAAISLCKKKRAALLIAKLDWLPQNVHFITGLMESDIPFVAADCPNDDRMMLQIRAVFAEEERRKISERTRQALAAANTKGRKLGAPAPEIGGRRGMVAVQAGANQFAANVLSVINSIQAADCSTLK